jgi:hypothetical protein
MITIPPTLAQPANLVLENMIVSNAQVFQATNSITVGPNFVITNTGTATLDAPSVTLRNLVFVVQGGKMYLLSETTSVDVESEEISIPTEFSLSQNYPNPFNPTTKIKYSVPEISFVTIKLYDALGNEITTLVNEEKEVGSYKIDFDGSRLSSGIYFYKMQTEKFMEIKKMVLLR